MGTFATLKKRREFLRVRGGAKWSASAFLMEAKFRYDPRANEPRADTPPTVSPRHGLGVPDLASLQAAAADKALRITAGRQHAVKTAPRDSKSGAAAANTEPEPADASPASPAATSDPDIAVCTTPETSAARFGFTVTKKLGNAVVRNRIKRRLREAVRATAPMDAKPGCDYVLIARPAALTQQFPELVADVRQGLRRVAAALAGGRTPPRKSRQGKRK